jgi:Galactosyltransferase
VSTAALCREEQGEQLPKWAMLAMLAPIITGSIVGTCPLLRNPPPSNLIVNVSLQLFTLSVHRKIMTFKTKKSLAVSALGLVILFALIANFSQGWGYPRHFSLSSRRKSAVWLIATISAAHDQQRRNIIRSTWQSLYRDDDIVTRFVISNPGDLWAPVVEHENATFRDLIVLPHLEETAKIANTIKSVELFKHLAAQGQRWAYVSKLDDDSFLDARTFYREFLRPHLHQPTSNSRFPLNSIPYTAPELQPTNRTVFGRVLSREQFSYPGGQFYTLSWDTMTLLARLHTQNPITDEHEDVLVGRLMYEAGEHFDLIELPNRAAFDYNAKLARGDGTAWAKDGADLDAFAHAVGPGSINPHKMRSDEDYLHVAACFDKDGLISRDKGE